MKPSGRWCRNEKNEGKRGKGWTDNKRDGKTHVEFGNRDMKKRKRMMGPMTGEEQEQLFAEVLATPKPLVAKIKSAMGYK